MRRFFTIGAIKKTAAVLGMLGAIALTPAFAYAQTPPASDPNAAVAAACNNNSACTDPKVAFDVNKNPMLKLGGFKYAPGTKFDANKYPIASQTPDHGLCVVYFGQGVLQSGCINNGQFELNADVIGGAGPTGDAPTGVNTTDSNGGDTFKPTTAPPVTGCNYLVLTTWPECLLKGTAILLLGFTNTLLGIAGTLFNWVVVKTVFQFATFIGNAPGLLISWGIMRDLGNILILFGFILIGMGTILDIDKMPNKKMLPALIIFAILLNFSLFAAEAVIDISNVFSSVMYTQAGTDAACASGTTASDKDCAINNGIAGHIMQSTGLSTILSSDKPGDGAGIPTLLMLILFSLVGAAVLFAGAIMILIRAIVLSFLIILSPIGFAGFVVPQLNKTAKEWWDVLLRESFFAPVFLLLILMSLKIADGFSGVVAAVSATTAAVPPAAAAAAGAATAAAGTAGAAAASGAASLTDTLASGNTAAMGNIMVYFAVIGFLVASLIMAKKMGAMGSTFAVNSATRLAFGSTNLATQGTARFARFGIQRSGLGETRVGKFAVGALRPIERGALDFRRIPGMQQGLKAAGATKGIAPTDSYGTLTSAVSELNPLNSNSKRATAERKLQEQELADVRQRNSRSELRTNLQEMSKSPSAKLSEKSERFIASLSSKQLEEMPEIKKADKNLISALSPDQFEGLMKSDALSGVAKDSLSNARYGDVLARAPEEIRQMSNKDLQQLAKSDNALFQQLVETDTMGKGKLTDDQMDNLMKSDALTRSQKMYVRAQTPSGRIESAVSGGDHLTAQRLATPMSPKNKVKLSAGALSSPGVSATFTPSDLGKIQEEAKLNEPQRRDIKRLVVDNATHPNHAAVQTWLAGNPIAAAYWNAP